MTRWVIILAQATALAGVGLATATDARLCRFVVPGDGQPRDAERPAPVRINPAETTPDSMPPRRPAQPRTEQAELLSARGATPEVSDTEDNAPPVTPAEPLHWVVPAGRSVGIAAAPPRACGPRDRLGAGWQPTGPPGG